MSKLTNEMVENMSDAEVLAYFRTPDHVRPKGFNAALRAFSVFGDGKVVESHHIALWNSVDGSFAISVTDGDSGMLIIRWDRMTEELARARAVQAIRDSVRGLRS